MCRLLGIYGRIDFWQEIAMEFCNQAEFGNIPPVDDMEPGHKDGWGMARSNRNKTTMVPVIRQLGSARESSISRQSVSLIKNAPAVFLGHLRKASDNIPVTLANVHPFFQKGWAFIHNGTVYDAESLVRDVSLTFTSDDSDSEYLFHYLLTAIISNPAKKRKSETLADAVSSLKVDYTSVNSMLSNGEDLYVISGCRTWEDYYTLHYYALTTGIVICSEPIESNRLNSNRWQRLANNTLLKIYGSPPKIHKIQISE